MIAQATLAGLIWASALIVGAEVAREDPADVVGYRAGLRRVPSLAVVRRRRAAVLVVERRRAGPTGHVGRRPAAGHSGPDRRAVVVLRLLASPGVPG